jgi:hypothetical protein
MLFSIEMWQRDIHLEIQMDLNWIDKKNGQLDFIHSTT